MDENDFLDKVYRDFPFRLTDYCRLDNDEDIFVVTTIKMNGKGWFVTFSSLSGYRKVVRRVNVDQSGLNFALGRKNQKFCVIGRN